MGMRMAQPQGLNAWARKLVEGQEVLLYTERGTITYSDGREEPFEREIRGSNVKSQQYDQYIGMGYDDWYPLMSYILPDGIVVEEVIGFTVWSSGPMIFLVLKKNGELVKESLWSVEEVNAIEFGLVDEVFLKETQVS